MSSRVITRCCPPSGTEPGDGASAEPAAGDELVIADGDLAADVHGRTGPDAWLERRHGQRRLRQREAQPGEPVARGLASHQSLASASFTWAMRSSSRL